MKATPQASGKEGGGGVKPEVKGVAMPSEATFSVGVTGTTPGIKKSRNS